MQLLILTGIILLTLVEWRSFFVEDAVGKYLNWRNQGREAWGRSWERQKLTSQAAKKLEDETASTTRLRREAELVSNFSELLAIIPDGSDVSISTDKFIELYRSFPQSLRLSLFNPGELADLYRGSLWVRTSIWREDSNLTAYLIDNHNRIITVVNVTAGFLEGAAAHRKILTGTLDDMPEFSGRIYEGSRFMDAFHGLSTEERSEIFIDPSLILDLPKRVTRVGWKPLEDDVGFVVVGFEFPGDDGSRVLTYAVSAEPFQHLVWKIVWAGTDTIFVDPFNDTLSYDPDWNGGSE